MTYQKTFQGAHKISAVVNGCLYTMQYMFCTKREALAKFKHDILDKP